MVPRVNVVASGLKLLRKKLMVRKGECQLYALGICWPSVQERPPTSWGAAFRGAGFDWQMLKLTYQCQDAVGMFLQGPRLIIRILPKQMAG